MVAACGTIPVEQERERSASIATHVHCTVLLLRNGCQTRSRKSELARTMSHSHCCRLYRSSPSCVRHPRYSDALANARPHDDWRTDTRVHIHTQLQSAAECMVCSRPAPQSAQAHSMVRHTAAQLPRPAQVAIRAHSGCAHAGAHACARVPHSRAAGRHYVAHAPSRRPLPEPLPPGPPSPELTSAQRQRPPAPPAESPPPGQPSETPPRASPATGRHDRSGGCHGPRACGRRAHARAARADLGAAAAPARATGRVAAAEPAVRAATAFRLSSRTGGSPARAARSAQHSGHAARPRNREREAGAEGAKALGAWSVRSSEVADVLTARHAPHGARDEPGARQESRAVPTALEVGTARTRGLRARQRAPLSRAR